MNEQTAKLIEQLAQQLGTTSEFIWSVLLKQAPVTAYINILYYVLITILCVVWWKLHKSFSNDDNNINYSDGDVLVGIPMALFALFNFIIVMIAFFSVEYTINGFMNPEYWALDYILSKLQK